MSFDAQCPHCGEEFDVEDRYESGEFNCPECYKRIWIEVNYEKTYEALCVDADHNWLPMVLDTSYQQCQTCRKLQRKPTEGNEVQS